MNHISLILLMSITAVKPIESDLINFVNERIMDEATIQLDGPVEQVFPLFGPIKEMEWAQGWNPEIIYSKTNEVELHMIFRTVGKFDGEDFYTWIITQYDPEKHFIEYSVSTAERIWFISVQCIKENNIAMAKVTYTFTGLTSKGNELNKISLKQMYSHRLTDWEAAINHYLHTGTLLKTHDK